MINRGFALSPRSSGTTWEFVLSRNSLTKDSARLGISCTWKQHKTAIYPQSVHPRTRLLILVPAIFRYGARFGGDPKENTELKEPVHTPPDTRIPGALWFPAFSAISVYPETRPACQLA